MSEGNPQESQPTPPENIEKVEINWGPESENPMTWVEAYEWCKEQGGRLPTSQELKSALEDKKAEFGSHPNYWTAYHYGASSSRFGYDKTTNEVTGDYASKSDKHYVRCVKI